MTKDQFDQMMASNNQVISLMAVQNKNNSTADVSSSRFWDFFMRGAVALLCFFVTTFAMWLFTINNVTRDNKTAINANKVEIARVSAEDEKDEKEYRQRVADKLSAYDSFMQSPRFAENLYVQKYHLGLVDNIENNARGTEKLSDKIENLEDGISGVAFDIKFIKSQFGEGK
jgi:hypothetical protein